MRELIYSVVDTFYEKAMKDVMIGYHFYKFGQPEVLEPHLQKITSFWEMQLTGTTSVPITTPFHLLFTHLQLKIKRGELGRWIKLFHETLDLLEEQTAAEYPQVKELTALWKERIAFFEQRFTDHPQMFN